MAAYSAVLRGASRVFVVDRVRERLDAAARIGAEPVNFEEHDDPVARILALNGGEMVDRSVDAVGYQAVNKGGAAEVPNIVLENMIKVTRACGGLGIPGLYVPTDPGAPDKAAGQGMISLSFGKLFEKVRNLFLVHLRWHQPEATDMDAEMTLTGTLPRDGPVQCQALQPLSSRFDHCWKGEAEFCGVSRGTSGSFRGIISPCCKPVSRNLEGSWASVAASATKTSLTELILFTDHNR